jgi:hypothetical protein
VCVCDVRVTITVKQTTVKDMSREDLETAFVRNKVELDQFKNKKAKTEAGKKNDHAAVHEAIVNDQTVVEVIGKMEELQINNPLALWWVTQWGEEFMQRFKKETGAYDDKEALTKYSRWTQGTDRREPAKKTAGMKHWSAKGTNSQPASGSATPSSSSKKKSAASPFI